MYKLAVHTKAQDDLRDLWARDTYAARKLAAFVSELRDDQELLELLLREGEHFGLFEVKPFETFWNEKRDISIVKHLEVNSTRIIYAFDRETKCFFILAFMPRDLDYNSSPGFMNRLREAYDQCGVKNL